MIERARKKIQTEGASNFLQHWGIYHGLKQEGKPHWEKFLGQLINGEPAVASEAIDALSGFERNLKGFDKLPDFDPNKGILVVGNHSNEGPLRGWGQFLIAQNAFRETTGREILWAQGQAASGASNTVSGSIETIQVGLGNGSAGARNILNALKDKAVGLFPEGTQKRDLVKAVPGAGKIIARAAKNKTPIVYIATSFSDGRLFTATGRITITTDVIDPQIIQDIEKTKRENLDPYQAIADYTMIKIAMNLPENRQGFYREGVKRFALAEKIKQLKLNSSLV